MLRRYQRNLVGGAGLAGFGLFLFLKMILGNEAKRRLIFYFLFPFLCKGDGGGGTRPCSNCFASLPQDYYYGAYYQSAKTFVATTYPSAGAFISNYIHTVSLESEKEKDALCEVQDGRFIETYKRTNY